MKIHYLIFTLITGITCANASFEEKLLEDAVSQEKAFLAKAEVALKSAEIEAIRLTAKSSADFFDIWNRMPKYLQFAYAQHTDGVYWKLKLLHEKEAQIYENDSKFCDAGYQYDLAAYACENMLYLYDKMFPGFFSKEDKLKLSTYYSRVTGDPENRYGIDDYFGLGNWMRRDEAAKLIDKAIENYKKVSDNDPFFGLAQKNMQLIERAKELKEDFAQIVQSRGYLVFKSVN